VDLRISCDNTMGYTSLSPIILEEVSVIRVSAESTSHCIYIFQLTDGSTSSSSHLVVPFFIHSFLESHILFTPGGGESRRKQIWPCQLKPYPDGLEVIN
jgi:hypothetical protein